MKIGSSIDTSIQSDVPVRTARVTGPQATPVGAVAADQATVSAAGTQLGALGAGDFDSAKVDAIRNAIREGRFTVNADAIADRLIADAHSLLRPRNA